MGTRWGSGRGTNALECLRAHACSLFLSLSPSLSLSLALSLPIPPSRFLTHSRIHSLTHSLTHERASEYALTRTNVRATTSWFGYI